MTRRLPPVARFRLHNSRLSYLPNPTLTITGQLHCKNADNDDMHLQLHNNSITPCIVLVITTWLGWNSARYGLPSFRLPTNHYNNRYKKISFRSYPCQFHVAPPCILILQVMINRTKRMTLISTKSTRIGLDCIGSKS